jgi:lytic cellulose monooxygenase (C1-hydroxylating)
MKVSLFVAALGSAALSEAHCIAQRLKVNGADQGSLVAMRVPNSNNPITNVQDSSIACNSGFISPVSSVVATVAAGQQVYVF